MFDVQWSLLNWPLSLITPPGGQFNKQDLVIDNSKVMREFMFFALVDQSLLRQKD